MSAGAWSHWPAPAKLNLFLHVTGRRSDGYHALQTVFQLLALCDGVSLRVRADGRLQRLRPLAGVPPEADLGWRAARTLQQATGSRLGADIVIAKQIPRGGGLGGGSSDAATVLVALNALWGTGLDGEALAALGAQLGSDVPVFVRGHTAWAGGRGEELVPLDLVPGWFVVVDPGVEVSTAALFAAPELTRDAAQMTIPCFLAGEPTANVFEPVARARFAEVAAALDWLGAHAPARLSGTGGCIFAPMPSATMARRLAAACPPPWQARAVRGVRRSPLLRRLALWRAGQGGAPAREDDHWGVAKR